MYKSTVHRVNNESTQERVSMPFFSDKLCILHPLMALRNACFICCHQYASHFYHRLTSIGLNFSCVEGVVLTCTLETNHPRYGPISCGDCKCSFAAGTRIVTDSTDSLAGCQMRFGRAQQDFQEKKKTQQELEKLAPSGKVVKACDELGQVRHHRSAQASVPYLGSSTAWR